MHRRQFLVATGVATSTALAGCNSDTGANDTESGGGTETGTRQTTIRETTTAMTETAERSGETTTTEMATATEATTTAMATEGGGSGGDMTPTAESDPDIEATPQATEVLIDTPSITPAASGQDDAYYESLIQEALQQESVSVSSVQSQDSTVQLTYTTFQTTESGIAEEIGKVAGAYAYAIGDGWDKQQMEVAVQAADGSTIGTYQIQQSWAQEYLDGDITAEEYALRVLQTLETTE